MWIDRTFAAKGVGTIVTGTLTLGADGDHAELACEDGALVMTIHAAATASDQWEDVLGRHLVRFAFCKRLEVLDEAVARLRTLT